MTTYSLRGKFQILEYTELLVHKSRYGNTSRKKCKKGKWAIDLQPSLFTSGGPQDVIQKQCGLFDQIGKSSL